MFGDKKTMYCHHIKGAEGPTVRLMAEAGKKAGTAEEVWEFLGRSPCCGRLAYNASTGKLVCGGLVKKDHDNPCNPETCPFIANGLECPVPKWAHKK